ncbi:MAG: OadG family transporter subunit [Lachnotalea sp.]
MKKFLLILCMITGVFSMTANATTQTTDYNGYTADDLKSNAESLYTSLSAFTDEEIAQYIASEDEITALAVESWSSVKDDLGDYVGVGDFTINDSEDAITTQLTVDYSEKDLLLTVVYDPDLTVTSITAEKETSMGDKMARAGLNTIMGIGTVFVILILMTFLISGFGLIYKWEEKKKIEKKNLDTLIAPIVEIPVVKEELVDDLELVAVISAAIAATTNTSTDDFVVRSIKRRTSKTR